MTLEGLENADFEVRPRYWVEERDVQKQLDRMGWQHEWLMGWRDICRSTDERTVISGVMLKCAAGNTLPLSFIKNFNMAYILPGIVTSFIFDFIARQKIGGTHLTYFYIFQFPVIPPEFFDQPAPWQPSLTLVEWLKPHILELNYTSEDMRPFAENMGYTGDPFIWNGEGRAQIRAELDAPFSISTFRPVPMAYGKRAITRQKRNNVNLLKHFPH